MVAGLVIAGHVHLTKIARSLGTGANIVHADEKRLSRHLDSEHWSMQPVAEGLLRWSAEMVGDDTLIVADLTDIAKYYARHLAGLGRARDASDPEKRTAPGYMLFEAYARVRRWQLFPLLIKPLRTYSGAPTSENEESLACFGRIHEATGRKGTWILDRGIDRRELMLPMLRMEAAFVVRQRGDRHIVTAGGRQLSVQERATEIFYQRDCTSRWPIDGWTCTDTVTLPEVPHQEFLLVVSWRIPGATPLMLLVSPQARLPGRTGTWFVKAYRRRWGVEDATWGVKQRFHLEEFLVRSWGSIRRLICLVAVAFFWLNLWGEDRYETLARPSSNIPGGYPRRSSICLTGLRLKSADFCILNPKYRYPPLLTLGELQCQR
jgi:hypothetical protein